MTGTAPRLIGDAIRQMLLADEPTGVIVRRFGCARETVSYHRRALGLPSPSKASGQSTGPRIRFRRCEACGGREDTRAPHQHGGAA